MHTGLSRQKRTAATHLFVVMISPEGRQRKPYALPIQCVPYTGTHRRTGLGHCEQSPPKKKYPCSCIGFTGVHQSANIHAGAQDSQSANRWTKEVLMIGYSQIMRQVIK